MRRQLALLLSRAQIPLEWLQPPASEDADAETELPEDIVECLSNTHLSRFFRDFGKELGVAEPKSLEDVYKSHLENTRKRVPSGLSLSLQEHVHFVNRRRLICERRFCQRKPSRHFRQRIRQCWVRKRQAHGRSRGGKQLGVQEQGSRSATYLTPCAH